AAFGLHGTRLVVMKKIAAIGQPHLCDQVESTIGIGESRRQPTIELLSGVLFDCINRVLDERALLVLAHLEDEARVVCTVRIELPPALGAFLNHFGMMLAHCDIEGDAAAHAAAVKGVEHAPKAGAVSVISIGISKHIRHWP